MCVSVRACMRARMYVCMYVCMYVPCCAMIVRQVRAFSIGLISSVHLTGSSVIGGAPTNSGMHLGLGMATGAAACLSAGVQQVLLPQTVHYKQHSTIHHSMLPVQKLLILSASRTVAELLGTGCSNFCGAR